ncbi:3-hydroxyacyl-CoA dehydrogenase NAD-binding domain-containing protein [Tundrisphaera lichenicola]|uniref:3-hydroxyacyl-CoA dehydrogenase NAD-binding domain-containing protein n=1 Tax=Tundrisphaera lichenicola TaxID=2029860 RepID=UPI003EBEAA6D
MPGAFQFEERSDGIGLITLDVPDKKVNTLSQAVLMELGALIARLGKQPNLKGLLFRSGKPGQFVAGADLKEIGALVFATKDQLGQAIDMGHALYDRISLLPFPTVALVDGPCMGGGTELILSMDERIVSNGPQSKIGLPEVKLGIIPGWGGTQRLPRLIGLNAIEMIATGEPVSASKAVELGMAFDAVPAEKLVEEGVRLIEFLVDSGEWKKNRERRRQPLDLSADQSAFAFATAEGAIRMKTKGHYPAPLVALKSIREGCRLPLQEALKVEREAALEVMGTPISGNLIAVFFMQNRLSREPGVDRTDVIPQPIRRVGVIGSGLMGSGIATSHARSGLPTAMVDVDEARLAGGLKRATEVITSRIKIGRASTEDLARMLGFLSTATSNEILADRDLVIEAITEDESAKAATYRELAKVMKKGAILASNTSTISITRLAESSADPERFVGLHFFNPVDRMELVEVIRGSKTSDETVATVVALARSIRKTPIVVKDCPGFLVNRVLLPYMNESLQLLQEGVPMDAIDEAAIRFGMPMGPIALHDLIGIDTAAYAGKVMIESYPDRAVPTRLLVDMLKAGRLGQKSGSGFRKHQGKKVSSDPDFDPILAKHRTGEVSMDREEITDRLFLPMLLEATRVLEEGIVREPADVDMGLILGIGFPPFRGGILRWADSVGAGTILERLGKIRSHGRRFEPTETLTRHANQGEFFYPMPRATSVV